MSNLTTVIALSLLLGFCLFCIYVIVLRWNKNFVKWWAKLLKAIVVIGLLSISVVTVFGVYNNYNDYLMYEKKKVFTKLKGIDLNWTEDELVFRKGKPKLVNQIEGLKQLTYDNSMLVALENNKITFIVSGCAEGLLTYEKFGGIGCYSSYDEVIAAYGTSKEISVNSDKTGRIYNYPEFNIGFELIEASVAYIFIFDAKENPKGLQFQTPKEKKKIENAHPSKANESNIEQKDHCEPKLSRDERIRRLSLLGKVREVGYQEFVAGNHKIKFLSSYADEIISCW